MHCASEPSAGSSSSKATAAGARSSAASEPLLTVPAVLGDRACRCAKFTCEDGTVLTADQITLKTKAMTVTCASDQVLPTGKGVLELEFRGTLNDQKAGFYRSMYIDLADKTKYMAVTQFEAIDARRSFP